MIYAYMRQIPELDNLVKQKQEILTFAHYKGLKIENEVVEYATKNLLIEERKEFEDFLKSLDDKAYTVMVSTLEVLSTRVSELVKVISCVLSHDVNLWIASENVLINKESNMTEIFPLLEAQRKKPKDKSSRIGRPKGSQSESKFDVYHSQIIASLSAKKSVSAIARELAVSRSSLKDYIDSRGLKELVNSISIPIHKMQEGNMDNTVVICPFELEAQEKMRESFSYE